MKKSILFLAMIFCVFLCYHTIAQPVMNLYQTTGSNDIYYFDDFGKWTFDNPNSTINLSKKDGSNKTYLFDDVKIITFNNDGNVVTIQYPSLMVSPTNVSAGNNSVSITGSNFTKNHFANLRITGPAGFGEKIPAIATNSTGAFVYSYLTTATMPSGTYSILGRDSSTSYFTTVKTFTINATAQTAFLEILNPKSGQTYFTDASFPVEWKDYMQKTGVYPVTGSQRAYNYAIEYSDNGGPWQALATKQGNEYLYSNISLNKNVTIPVSSTTIKIRVVDLYSNINMESGTFTVQTPVVNNIQVDLLWDKSYPDPGVPINGIAADGTARFYMKLSKIDPGQGPQISSVTVSLNDGVSATIEKLGKVMKASQLSSYNSEANSANQFTAQDNTSNKTDYDFWYVAPDDFARAGGADDTKSGRQVKAKFTVNYANSTTDTLTEFITIVRPPLMLVHGLGGDPSTFSDFRHSEVSGSEVRFVEDNRFKIKHAVTLRKDAHFIENASTLVLAPVNDMNGFDGLISAMRGQGYVSNRVDYVCHSMGGSVFRSLLDNYYSWYTRTAGSRQVKNYEKGYVNKFISLDTPHEGSPLADLIKRYSGDLGCWARSTLLVWYAHSDAEVPFPFVFLQPKDLEGSWCILSYFVPTKTWEFQPSNAVYDLCVKGGIKFHETNIKAHLIAGDILPGEQTNNQVLVNQEIIDMIHAVGHDYFEKFMEDLLKVAIPKEKNNSILYAELKEIMSLKNIPLVDKVLRFMNAVVVLGEIGNYSTFVPESDLIVGVKSQLAGLDRNTATNVSVFDKVAHTIYKPVTKSVAVGNKVLSLLNSDINSSLFSNKIDPSPLMKPKNDVLLKQAGGGDTLIVRSDSTRLKIISPQNLSVYLADSAIKIKVSISDTANLLSAEVYFQNKSYSLDSLFEGTAEIITQVNNNVIGNQEITAELYYSYPDSSVLLIDRVMTVVMTNDTITGFSLEPHIIYQSKGELKSPTITAVYSSFSSPVSLSDSLLSIWVADTSILFFENAKNGFMGKSEGETFAILSYSGFSDTLYFVVKGCSMSSTTYLTVNGNLTFCSGDSVTLEMPPSDNILWNTGDTAARLTVKQSGNYSAIATDSLGCSTFSNIVNVKVNLPVDTAKIISNSPSNFCMGDSIILNSGSNKNNLWAGGDTSSFITITTAGKYFLTVSDSNGCKTTDSIFIATDSLPLVYIGADTALNDGDTLLLDAGNSGSTYQWSNGDSSQIIKISKEGNYSVTVTDANSCKGIDSMNVTIITRINENISYSDNIKVYPNPVKNSLTIEIENLDNSVVEISITNIAGKQLKKEIFNQKTKGKFLKDVDMGGLADQVYLVNVKINDRTWVRKISKIK